MSTFKNIQTKIGFWLYDNSYGLMIVSFFLMVFSLFTTIIFVTRNTPTHETSFNFSVFLYFIPFFIIVVLFLFFFVACTDRKKWERSSNYLIVIDLARKLREKISAQGKMTGEISGRLSIQVAGAVGTKNSKELTAWMWNYRAWGKFQKSIDEKKTLLKELTKLSSEIAEMENRQKILWKGLMS
ncbi:MAG: hypothetical protein Athens071416_424 [Parcubacteria group bacterium Athens0714_16]|nr:MAG: hypothetical protein Athens071416_424 [Parcubacteria group bacterium Athens0714_16]